MKQLILALFLVFMIAGKASAQTVSGTVTEVKGFLSKLESVLSAEVKVVESAVKSGFGTVEKAAKSAVSTVDNAVEGAVKAVEAAL